MLPFRVHIGPGESPYRQIVYAATKAVVSGELIAGEAFPSVRVLSRELKVNPNTAHKVITELVRDGILEVLPGVGTVVADWGSTSPEARRRLLSDEVERLVVEARRLGLSEGDVHAAVEERWWSLFETSGDPDGDVAAG